MANRLLIIGAHPDDPAGWGGTLSRFHREGWETMVYICSRGQEKHVDAYKPWADEVVAKPYDIIDPTNNTNVEFGDVITEFKPKITITHSPTTRFTEHVLIANKVQEEVYWRDRNNYITREVECWAGDADWEGPILQYPEIFVRITKEDLDAKIKMLQDTGGWMTPKKHLSQWCTTLAKYRSLCIFEDDGLAEAYKSIQPRII